ncbi:MAG: hypothetical protein P8M62_05680, partial [Opitutae bacterium]|nr:hypothetical protein [Opitutae bacterium]
MTGNVLIDNVNQLTMNPGLAFDYSLLAASVARDAGTLSRYAAIDLDGETLADGLKDIGADEFTDSDNDGLPDWVVNYLAGTGLTTTGDSDNDHLTNLEEFNAGGNPLSSDTDGDGLLDGDEFYDNGTHGDTDGYTTGVNNPDSDGDGLGDGWEVDYGFNPTSANAPSTDSDGDGLTDKQEFSSGGNPFSGDTDNNGMPDALEYRYEMNLNTHVDSDADGMPDDYETAFGLSPTDPSDASLDRDSDALSNLEEYQLGTRANYFDSDGDLLGDGWEVNQGLNPLQANLLDGDSDQDGLDTYDEYLNGTNPSLGDSDSDGTPDGTEVAQGSNPANANDNGQSPATDKLQEVNFTVGDPSGSHSERWEMTITGLGADTRVMRLSNRDFGTMTNPTPYKLWKDSNYEITIAHLGTKQTGNGPDYDWQAQVEGTPSNWVLTGGNKHTGTNRFSVIHNQWILDNEDGLLGIVDESFNNSNHASDKSAKLLKVDLDIVHPATGELDDSEEDADDGGYVSVQRQLDDGDGGTEDVAPVTQLKLHANSSLPSTAKFRLKFTDDGHYKIYSDLERTTEVVSEQTEFAANVDTTLYFQGLEKSFSRGGEEVTMQIGVGGNWYDGDSVKCTVVQSEFLIQIKAFIPYAWTEAENQIPFNPMWGKVAKGDLHPGNNDRRFGEAFLNVYSDNSANFFPSAPFRVMQTVVLTPYEDLHKSAEKVAERKTQTGQLSEHYLKDTGVPQSSQHLQFGYASLFAAGFDRSGVPPVTQSVFQGLTRSSEGTTITLEAAGKDGAMPNDVVTWFTADIHWDIEVSVQVDGGGAFPLGPKIKYDGCF